MTANPCKICHTSAHLKAKWNSEDKTGWIHCDECGQISEPVSLDRGNRAIIEKWNEANPRSEHEQ